MKWPWARYRQAAVAAAAEAAVAGQERQESVRRLDAVARQAACARAISADLRREIENNGWTEKLQKAWGQ